VRRPLREAVAASRLRTSPQPPVALLLPRAFCSTSSHDSSDLPAAYADLTLWYRMKLQAPAPDIMTLPQHG
jgi:hypothetical protein